VRACICVLIPSVAQSTVTLQHTASSNADPTHHRVKSRCPHLSKKSEMLRHVKVDHERKSIHILVPQNQSRIDCYVGTDKHFHFLRYLRFSRRWRFKSRSSGLWCGSVLVLPPSWGWIIYFVSEDGGSMVHRNVGTLPTTPLDGVTTHKTVIHISVHFMFSSIISIQTLCGFSTEQFCVFLIFCDHLLKRASCYSWTTGQWPVLNRQSSSDEQISFDETQWSEHDSDTA
jgi:hypothetical protein